jgi:hypothetical protein
MARKKSPDETVALFDFAYAALDAAEVLGIKRQVVADFPLGRPERLFVARLASLPAILKEKLRKKDVTEFTVAQTARILIGTAKSLSRHTGIHAVNLLLVSKGLAECLRRNVWPAAPTKAKKPRLAHAIFQLKITLLGCNPPIWRRIQVEDCTLDELHEHIQTAMGWENSHLHHFRVGDQLYGDPELMQENFDELGYDDSTSTTLGALISPDAKKFRLVYEYDFGDSWEHEVLFEKSLSIDGKTKYPVCIDGKRACPPDDVGGVWGYPAFLEAIRNEADERHEELLEWIGGSFDPEAFDPAAATRAMQKGLPDWRRAY